MGPPSAQNKIWRYSTAVNGLENHLELHTVPIPDPKPTQHLIRVLAVGLNPADYKFAETPIISRLAISKPATPGLDIAGEIVVPAAGSQFKQGQLVFGAPDGSLLAGGGLAQFTTSVDKQIAAIPDGVSATDAAALPVAAVTAYQTLSLIQPGGRVFFNGGSGGVGVIAIQIAKVLGHHITVTCSTRNVALCRSLGADDVVDYTKTDVVTALSQSQEKFDLVVDGVGSDTNLFWKCDRYTKPGAKYAIIGMSPTLAGFGFIFLASVLPVFLGGQSRKLVPYSSQMKAEDLQRVMTWVAEGKIKVVVDSRFPMDQVPDAFRSLKKGRATGKIVIDVVPENERG